MSKFNGATLLVICVICGKESFAFNDLMEFVYLGRREAKNVEVKPPLLAVNIEPPSFDDALEVMIMDDLIVSKMSSEEETSGGKESQ